MRIFRVLILLAICNLTNANEIQFNCVYKNETSMTNFNTENPNFNTNKKQVEYLIFINQNNNEASYINVSHKIKSPLKIISSKPQLISFLEINSSDNYFTLTIYKNKDSQNNLPSTIYLHAWNESYASGFYQPKISLGRCMQIGG